MPWNELRYPATIERTTLDKAESADDSGSLLARTLLLDECHWNR